MELKELISSLKQKTYYKFPNVNIIISKLEKMDSIIEMKSVKNAFAGQLALIISMARRGYLPPFKKMHSVLSGPPGVGKTTMSMLMAEIWSALNIMDKKRSTIKLDLNPEDSPLESSLSENENESGELIDEKKDIAYIMSSVQDKMCDIIRTIDKVYGSKPGKIPESIKTIHSKSSDSADLCQEVVDKYSKYFMQLNDYEEISTNECNDVKPYVILGRQDFVGTHQGHTTQKTEKILRENKGKVIIIEEAYLLSTDPKDSYGMEALTLINRYMDEHSDDYIFIFNGYEDLLERTIFKVQPGLRRRIQWTFTIEDYSFKGVYEILKNQLSRFTEPYWKLDQRDEKKYLDFFMNNITKFPHFGGDTERLILNIQLEFALDSFNKPIDDPKEIIIDFKTFKKGFEKYLENFTEPETSIHKRPPPFGMFL